LLARTGMEELRITDGLLQFTVLAAAVLVVQLAFERLRIPALVGLLIVGMLVGSGGFAVIPEEPVVDVFGRIGLVYIMFLAGVEVDLDVVREHKSESVVFGLLAFVLSAAPGLAVGAWFGYGWAGALLLAAAVSSHTLVAYPIVERLRLLHRRPIVATVGGTLLTDTIALVMLAVVLQQAATSDEHFDNWYAPLLLLVALVAVSIAALPWIGRRFFAAANATRVQKALAALVVLLLLSTAAEAVGTESILGAFLAGVCLNRPLRAHGDLLEHIRFAGGMVFIPFFFIQTGMRLELEVLVGGGDAWWLAAVLLAVIVFGKFSAAWATGARFGYRPVARMAMASLALPQAAATLAVIVTAREAELLDKVAVDAIIIVIFVTCLAGPIGTRIAGRRLADAEPRG
jgi:Kef-type K+ transport system membrane component KefB